MLVNIVLKDGTNLMGCSIFPEDVKNGDMPYTSKEEIENALRHVPWGNKYVSFQNKYINGTAHVNNVEYFEIIQ